MPERAVLIAARLTSDDNAQVQGTTARRLPRGSGHSQAVIGNDVGLCRSFGATAELSRWRMSTSW